MTDLSLTGRPRKLTPAVQDAILDVLREGCYFTTACQANGISINTATKWLDRGRTELARLEAGMTDTDREEQGHPPAQLEALYAQFAQAVEAIRAHSERRVVKSIHTQIEGGWIKERRKDPETDEIVEVRAGPDGRLGLEWLARVHPSRYGRRQTLEVTGEAGGPVQVEASIGVRLAEDLRQFLDGVRENPRVIEGQVIRRELVAGSPAPAADDDRSDSDSDRD